MNLSSSITTIKVEKRKIFVFHLFPLCQEINMLLPPKKRKKRTMLDSLFLPETAKAGRYVQNSAKLSMYPQSFR